MQIQSTANVQRDLSRYPSCGALLANRAAIDADLGAGDDRFDEQLTNLYHTQVGRVSVSAKFWTLLEIIPNLTLIVVLGFGAYAAGHGFVTMGTLVVINCGCMMPSRDDCPSCPRVLMLRIGGRDRETAPHGLPGRIRH